MSWLNFEVSFFSYDRDPSSSVSPFFPRNRWLPLPEIYYGIATANYRPSAVNLASTSVSARNNRYSWSRDSNVSSLRSNGGDGAVGNVFEQEVLVGDEVYAFETCRSDDDVEWYRG